MHKTFDVSGHTLTIHTGFDKRWNPSRETLEDIQAVLVNLIKNHGKKSTIRFKGHAQVVWAPVLGTMLVGLGEVTAKKLKEVLSFEGSKAFIEEISRRLPAALYRAQMA